jgi:hypothetical protein
VSDGTEFILSIEPEHDGEQSEPPAMG